MRVACCSDVGCKTVANMIKGKTPEEIRKLFNIVNDFTPEEEVRTTHFHISAIASASRRLLTCCPLFSGSDQEGKRKCHRTRLFTPDADTDSTDAAGMGGGPLGCRCSLGGGRVLFICRSAVYMFFIIAIPSVYYHARGKKSLSLRLTVNQLRVCASGDKAAGWDSKDHCPVSTIQISHREHWRRWLLRAV